jgi:hypothetical protein
MAGVRVLVGTKKGAFIGTGTLADAEFAGEESDSSGASPCFETRCSAKA